MHLPPRNPKKALFDLKYGLLSLLQGLWLLLLCLLALGFAVWQKRPEDEARSFTFFTLMLGNLALILVNRSHKESLLFTLRKRNPAFLIVLGGVILFGGLVAFLPPLQKLFSFGQLSSLYLALCLGAGFCALLGFEGIKKLIQWAFRKRSLS